MRIPVITLVLVLTLFFLSGASSLIYEVVWVRMFTQVFGSTSLAVSTVLTAFMAGLSLGSYLFGQLADRYERWTLFLYGLLEGAIGAYALAVPFLISLVESLHASMYRAYGPSYWGFILMRFAVCLVFLLPPTTMMGATLPLLARFIVKRPQTLGNRVGILYAINTAGAVVGVYLTGFAFIGHLGLTRTMYLAIAINQLVMVMAFILAAGFRRSEGEQTLPANSPEPSMVEVAEVRDRGKARIILLCFALAGFASLCYEVLWTRTLVFFLGLSTYAFTSMLTTFLLGLSLGSLLFARAADRSPDRYLLFCKIEAGIALWALLSIPMFNEVFYAVQQRWEYFINIDMTWESMAGLKFLKAFAVMIVPTTLMGGAFPVVCRIFSSDLERVGRDVAAVYSVNTLGAIAGSAAAGLLIIPVFGTQNGIMVVAAINIGIAVVALLMSHASAIKKVAVFGILSAATAAAVFVVPRDVVLRIPYEIWKELLFYEEDSMALVKVYEKYDGDKCLSIDGDILAGSSEIMQTNQKMLAHLPMLLHDDPQTVLVVGFGAGGTSWSMSLYEPERIDCVEFVPSVIKAAPYLAEVNHDVLSLPIFHLFLDDGRTYLRTTDRNYDVISVDAIDPKHSGSSNLYSAEFYQSCREHLNPGGVMVQWLPYIWLTEDETAAILASFASAFEYPTLWFNRHFTYFLMVGSDHEFEIDYQRLSRRMSNPKLAADLGDIHLSEPAEFLYLFAADTDAFKEVASRADVMNTYDRPVIEFYEYREGDRLEYQPFAGRKGDLKITNLGATPEEAKRNRENIEFHMKVTDHIIHALHFDRKREPIDRWRHYKAALALDPSDAVALYRALPADKHINKMLEKRIALAEESPSPDAYSKLAALYYQMGDLSSAVNTMEEAVRLFPASLEMRLNLAGYYETMGRHREALQQRQSVAGGGNGVRP